MKWKLNSKRDPYLKFNVTVPVYGVLGQLGYCTDRHKDQRPGALRRIASIFLPLEVRYVAILCQGQEACLEDRQEDSEPAGLPAHCTGQVLTERHITNNTVIKDLHRFIYSRIISK